MLHQNEGEWAEISLDVGFDLTSVIDSENIEH